MKWLEYVGFQEMFEIEGLFSCKLPKDFNKTVHYQHGICIREH